jgi:hypothetical protein
VRVHGKGVTAARQGGGRAVAPGDRLDQVGGRGVVAEVDRAPRPVIVRSTAQES